VLSAPVDALPVIGWEPLQSPDAAHEVAFAELQLSADELPLTTLVGLAVKVTVGAACTVEVGVGCGVVVADDGADDVEPELQAVTVTVTTKTRAICVLARASLGIIVLPSYCANSDPTTGSQRRSHGTDDSPGAWFSAQWQLYLSRLQRALQVGCSARSIVKSLHRAWLAYRRLRCR
jgi:hypothetical protein